MDSLASQGLYPPLVQATALDRLPQRQVFAWRLVNMEAKCSSTESGHERGL